MMYFGKYTSPGPLLVFHQNRYIVFVRVYPPRLRPKVPLMQSVTASSLLFHHSLLSLCCSLQCCVVLSDCYPLPCPATERGCTFHSVTLLHYLAPSTRRLLLSQAGCCWLTLFACCSLFFFLCSLTAFFYLNQKVFLLARLPEPPPPPNIRFFSKSHNF